MFPWPVTVTVFKVWYRSPIFDSAEAWAQTWMLSGECDTIDDANTCAARCSERGGLTPFIEAVQVER